jgi:5-methylcytosine-specific restriction endonuclease McrBC regulatory subunit McrC
MSRLLEIQEGVGVDIGLFLGEGNCLEERERFRDRVARINSILRRDLGLRESALQIIHGENDVLVVARGVTGTLRIGSVEVDVRPKHAASSEGNWRAATVAMLERCARARLRFTRMNRLQLKPRTLIDQFAFGFAAELEEATRYAEIRMYRATREELSCLRGRLLVAAQLRSSLTRPHRLVCEVDTLDADNSANRLLHWVAKSLDPLIQDQKVRRYLSEQAAKLPPVSGPVKLPTPLVAVVPRQFSHYENVVNLALAYAKGRTVFPGISGVGGAGFIVGTERLFESFIEKSLEVLIQTMPGGPWRVRAQEREPFAEPVAEGTRYFSKPDNVVDEASVPRLVIDAKYKLFGDSVERQVASKPASGDLYQMAAACIAHRCSTALLIYPRLKDDVSDLNRAWDIRWWNLPDLGSHPIRVGAVAVDLAELGDRAGLQLFDQRTSLVVREAIAKGAV